MDFVTIAAGEHDLGWRFSDHLTPEVRQGLSCFTDLDSFLGRFSVRRQVQLPRFEIACSATFTAEELLDDGCALKLETLLDVCNACDDALRPRGLRLPTEDEHEAAFGGSMFPWGNTVPDGIPIHQRTRFVAHTQPTERGLRMIGDTYLPELVRTAFKFGDGGEAVCGGYPWPIAWFSFCPSFRLPGSKVEEVLFEFLETAHIRAVRL